MRPERSRCRLGHRRRPPRTVRNSASRSTSRRTCRHKRCHTSLSTCHHRPCRMRHHNRCHTSHRTGHHRLRHMKRRICHRRRCSTSHRMGRHRPPRMRRTHHRQPRRPLLRTSRTGMAAIMARVGTTRTTTTDLHALPRSSAGDAARKTQCEGAIRQITLPPSSATSNAPSAATVTPAGRPQTSRSSSTMPVMKSWYSPVGTPFFIMTRTTL
jgi:hypothetical protein